MTDVVMGLDRQPIVFLGPSLPLEEAKRYLRAEYRAPCRRGDMETCRAGEVVGIIDGVFDQQLSVSPREIFEAIDRGVTIYGSSSMGALRALEVPGMRGIGNVFEMYRRGDIDSDDEVALLFDPVRLVPVTVPLVNVRYSLKALGRSELLPPDCIERVLEAACRLHYTERTYERIADEAGWRDGTAGQRELIGLLRRFDVKAEDARVLLDHLASEAKGPRSAEDHSARAQGGSGRRLVHRSSAPSLSLERPPEADGEILIWETGDRVEMNDLLEFLKVTGQFLPYAFNVLLRRLMVGSPREPGAVAEVSRAVAEGVDSAFKERCVNWGWKSAEEALISLTDLGLSESQVRNHLLVEAQAAAYLTGLARQPDVSFVEAMRAELFANDIALKREAMICASVASCAETAAGQLAFDEAWAKGVVCRMHGVPDWGSALAGLSSVGLDDRRVREWLGRLRAAATTALKYREVKLAPRPNSQSTKAPVLGPTPKAAGELRFTLPLTDAFAHASRIKDVIDVTRVGMIDRLADIEGVYVSLAARPTGSWSSTYGSGKSTSAEGAFVGGVMEECEKWAQERFIGSPFVSSYTELNGRADVVDPKTLDLPYDTRYTETLAIPWQRCADWIREESALVPLAAVSCDQNAGPNNIYYSPRAGRVVFSTNGLASGFAPAEALVHATCECIERHATKISELKVSNPGLRRVHAWPRLINCDTVMVATRELIAKLLAAKYRVRLWDITSDVRVPSIYARIRKGATLSSGFATHPNPDVACQMALLEACQAVSGNIAGGREDLDVRARSLGRHERPRPTRMAAHAFWDGAGQEAIPVQAMEGMTSADAAEEFAWVVQRLREAGVDRLLAVDLSRSAIAPVKVVRVVIPGLDTTNAFYCGPRSRAVLAQDVLLA